MVSINDITINLLHVTVLNHIIIIKLYMYYMFIWWFHTRIVKLIKW